MTACACSCEVKRNHVGASSLLYPNPEKLLAVMVCFLFGVLTACQPAASGTLAQKDVSYDSFLFACTFQHPAAWKVGNVFDSGGVALIISDVDPMEAFGINNRTGNEIIITLFGGGDSKVGFVPVEFLGELGQGPINSKIYEFDEGDKQFAYVLNSGELRAAMVNQQKVYWFRGAYPVEKESVVQDGFETILRSFEIISVEDHEISKEMPLGERKEGTLATAIPGDGYIPFGSRSVWTIEGKAGQRLVISIDPDGPQASLMLDIVDQKGKSIIPNGALSFTGRYISDQVRLPENGSYKIRVSPLPIMGWYGPYKITLK